MATVMVTSTTAAISMHPILRTCRRQTRAYTSHARAGTARALAVAGSIVDAVASKVLFVYNDPAAPEALLGEVFCELGFDIETFGVVPPERVADPAVDAVFPDPACYDVIVALGSRWSVYDERLRRTWVGAEMRLIREAAAAGIGVLGVCFGGQLVAQALGGTVGRSPAPELGWYLIDSDVGFLADGPWFQWHGDRWTTPPGGTEIARNGNAAQAFVAGTALALQFHPELDLPLLQAWLDDDQDGDMVRLGADAVELRAQTMAQRTAAPARLRALVSGFLGSIARHT
jgi:GMP synthase-like glutamine amidotransferase